MKTVLKIAAPIVGIAAAGGTALIIKKRVDAKRAAERRKILYSITKLYDKLKRGK